MAFTVIGERKFKQIEWGAEMPSCEHPDDDDLIGPSIETCEKPGEFDAPSIWGPWANFCADHILTDTPAHTTMGYHRIPKEKP